MTPYNASILAALFMVAFVPAALFFDATLKRHRAALATMLLGVLFMPWVNIDLGGLLDWNRRTAIAVTILFGAILRDPERLFGWRPNCWDIPVIVYCLVPIPTSMLNGLGIYDGFASAFQQTLWFGAPYLVGRTFFTSPEHRRDLVRAVLLGTIIYAPFCVWEIRMSPQLHAKLYGFLQHEFQQTVRGSFYRPMVFMQHGLMVAIWMCAGCVLANMMRINRDPWRPFGFSWLWIMMGLAVVLVGMQSLGAAILMAGFLVTIEFCRLTDTRWPLLLLLIAPWVWAGARTTGVLDSENLGNLVAEISPDRARSFSSRLYTEDVLVNHTWQQPLLGYGTWGRDRVVMVEGQERYIVVDGFWILAFSRYGLIGLTALLALHFLPAWRVLRRTRPRDWGRASDHGVCAALAIALTLISVDNLMNAMMNPFWLAIAGALANTNGDEPEVEPDEEQIAMGDEGPFPHVLGQARLG